MVERILWRDMAETIRGVSVLNLPVLPEITLFYHQQAIPHWYGDSWCHILVTPSISAS